jgi:hypothetical protein
MDDDGWIAMVNFRSHVLKDFSAAQIDRYIVSGGKLQTEEWRTFLPFDFFDHIQNQVMKRIG